MGDGSESLDDGEVEGVENAAACVRSPSPDSRATASYSPRAPASEALGDAVAPPDGAGGLIDRGRD